MTPASSAPSGTTQSDTAAEKRSAPRVPASQVPSITGIRLSPHGTEAKLVDISATGLLAECASRLKVGWSVAVLFEGGFTPASVVGRIARCAVASMGRDGILRYHVGVAFNKPIPLLVESKPAATPGSATAVPLEAQAPRPPHIRPVVRNHW